MTAVAPMPQGQFRPTGRFSPANEQADDKLALSILAFIAPTLLWVEFSLVGRVFATELILIGLLPFLILVRGTMLLEPLPRTFLILAAMFLMAQVLTDIIRDTTFRDYSRGWSKIIFMTMNFAAIYLLVYGSRKRITLFALGLVVGGYLSFLLNPSDFALRQPWKFGLGVPTIILVLLIVQWRPISRVWFLPALMIVTVGMYSMAVGSRSMAGIAILTALYVLIQQMVARKNTTPAGFSPVRTVLFFVGGVMIAATLFNSYQFAASEGMLGDDAQEIFARQSGGQFGVLLGGRSEIFISSQAVMDSPLIGHGSWAKNRDYVARIYELERYGYDITYFASEEGLIPTHSHLMGGWVEAGIMGAIFWFWVLVLVFRVMSNLYMVREPLSPVVTFVGFLMLWDIIFSPFGAERRVTVPFNIVMMMFVWEVLRSSVPREMLGGIRHRMPRRQRQPNGEPSGQLPRNVPPQDPRKMRHPMRPHHPGQQINRPLPRGVRPGPPGTAPRPKNWRPN